MKNIVLISPVFHSIGVDYLRKRHNVYLAPDGREETLISYVRDYNASALISRTERITRTVVENCPNLLVVGQGSAGIDNIDVEACSDNGVIVVHAPESNYVSLAEHTMMFILALSRQLIFSDKLVRVGNWGMRSSYLPTEIHSKTLFLIGTGRGAQETARLAKSFNMKVKVYSRNPQHELFLKNGIEVLRSMEEGLACADFVSVHVPLTAETHHLISTDQLGLMKRTACLLNMSRGAVVDPQALHDALAEERIAAAALDVLSQEPPAEDEPLLSLPNVMFTPHTAGDTHEALKRSVTAVVEEVDRVLSGIPPVCPANPDVLVAAHCRFMKN